MPYLDGSFYKSITDRVTAVENGTGNPGGLPARIAALESKHDSPVSYMGRVSSQVPQGDVLSSGWGDDVNDKIGEIQTYINTKVAPAIEQHGITASS